MPRYLPGRAPVGPGLFWRFDRPLRTLDAALATLRDDAEAYERRRRRVWVLAPALLALPVAGALIDLALGFDVWLFTRCAPAYVGAFLLCAWSAAPRAPRGSPLIDAALRESAKVGVAALIFLAFGAAAVVSLRVAPGPVVLVVTLLLLPLVVLTIAPVRSLLPLLRARLGGLVRAEPRWRAPLADLRDLVAALEPVAEAGRPVVGFVDLVGPERAWKELRLPPRPDIGAHRVFRDEWAQLEFALRGGGRLRLRLVEQLDRRDAGALASLATSGPLPLRDPVFSHHALIVSFWPGPAAVEPPAERARPASLARLRYGPRRRLIALALENGRVDFEALSLALRLLDPALHLARRGGLRA